LTQVKGLRAVLNIRDLAQISYKSLELGLAGVIIPCSKNRRRMHRCHDMGSEVRMNQFSAISRNAEIFPQQGLGRRRP